MGFIIENGVVEFLYFFLLAFWITYVYFVKDYGYWEERNVPHVPAVFPFGSMRDIVLGQCFWGIAYDKLYKEFKNERYIGLIDVRKPCLLIRDPNLIKLILQKDFNSFVDRTWCNTHRNDYIMNHLFHMQGQEWRDMRSKLTPAYTAAKMRMMFFLVKKCSDILRNVVGEMTEKNNIIDVKDVLTRFTIDVIATCAFGIDINSLSNKDSEFYRMGLKATKLDYQTLFKLYMYNAFPVFLKLHCFNFYDSKLRNFFTDVIRSTVEYREKYEMNRYDFLDLLIKLRQNQSILEEGENPVDSKESFQSEKKEGLTIEEITAETFLFFVAGFESTSNTVLFCLYELACNREIQNKLYWEVQEALEAHEGQISYQALQEMTYMDQVINEALRRYPVFPQIFRCCTRNYKFPKSHLEIEKNTRIVIPAYSLHHDPKYFPDPFTFDPERFSANNCKERHPYVFLPFGEGPRMCIGFRFGLMNVKTALASILSDYEISLTSDTDVPLKLKKNCFFSLPDKPLMLIFHSRRSKYKSESELDKTQFGNGACATED